MNKYVIVVYGEDMAKRVIGPFNKSESEENSDMAAWLAVNFQGGKEDWWDVLPLEDPITAPAVVNE